MTEVWRHRTANEWPPSNAVGERWHLRANAKLTTALPGVSEGPATITHVVPASYGPAEFAADDGELSKVTTKINESKRVFETAPFTKDVEYACLPRLSLSIGSTAARVVLGARLSVVDGSSARILSSGGVGARFTSVPGSRRFTIDLAPFATIIKAGQRLRLEISNFDLQTPGANSVFRRLPTFADYTAFVRHNVLERSWLELSSLPYVMPSVSSSETTISITNPQPKPLKIRSSPAWKDGFYVLFLGFSGEGPPQVFPGGSELWMVPDPATVAFSSAVNQPVQQQFAGVLDAKGEASATLNLGLINGGNLPPSILGISVTVGPTFFTFARGFEAGTACRLRFR